MVAVLMVVLDDDTDVAIISVDYCAELDIQKVEVSRSHSSKTVRRN